MYRKPINPASLFHSPREIYNFDEFPYRYENGVKIIECPSRYAEGAESQRNLGYHE